MAEQRDRTKPEASRSKARAAAPPPVWLYPLLMAGAVGAVLWVIRDEGRRGRDEVRDVVKEDVPGGLVDGVDRVLDRAERLAKSSRIDQAVGRVLDGLRKKPDPDPGDGDGDGRETAPPPAVPPAVPPEPEAAPAPPTPPPSTTAQATGPGTSPAAPE